MPTDAPQTPFESRYPQLALPPGGFVSNIPAHLLEGCDDQTRWLLQEISKNTAATEFACRGVVELSQHLRTLNGKTYRNEKGLADARQELEALTEKATTMEPFFKPLSRVIDLWEYKAFRWGVYIVGFFLLTYVLPVYLNHPLSIADFFALFHS